MNIQKGKIIIAKPSLLDDNIFNRSVLLLTECSKKETVGFILNKPSPLLLQDVFPTIPCEFPLYFGGPVEQDNLYFIHNQPQHIKNSAFICEGLYWGGNFENLIALLSEKKIESSEIRFFLGYSGWTKNQLEQEVENDFWILEKEFCTITIFKEDFATIWKNKISALGGNYLLFANTPENPLWN